MQERVRILEKELALKEAKLASMQQTDSTSNNEETGGAAGDDSVESSACEFVNQFSDEVARLRSWLGDRGYLAADGIVRHPLTHSEVCAVACVHVQHACALRLQRCCADLARHCRAAACC
jgi:hypothetical protein